MPRDIRFIKEKYAYPTVYQLKFTLNILHETPYKDVVL